MDPRPTTVWGEVIGQWPKECIRFLIKQSLNHAYLSHLINLTLALPMSLAVDFGTDVDVGVKKSKRNILVTADNLKRA